METRDMPEIRFENDVPWKRNRFGELYRKSDERNNGQFGWNKTISIATMTWNETGNGAADSSLASYKVLRTGDIAFEGHTNKEFQFGRFVLNDIGDGITSSIFTILRPTTNQNIIFWKYLIHDEAVMRRKLVYSTKSGIMMNGLVVDDFMKQTIRFPSLPVQREIADLFSSLDRKLAAEQKKLAALKMAKHALLVKIFPREGETVPEIRFEGFSHPWEQRKFGDVFEEYSIKGHPELPALTIIQGGGTVRRDESARNLVYDKGSLSNYKVVKEGDFIVHLRSFEGGLEKATNLGIISPAYHTFHGEGTNSRFYYSYFRSSKFIEQDLKPHVYGIRDGRSIDIEGMKTIEIPWTSYDEQKAIGDYIDKLDSLITLHQRKCDKLRQAKSALLNQMFV